MKHYIIIKCIVLMSLLSGIMSCKNSGDILDDIISQGPIIYSAKVDTLSCQSGFYRLKVNIYPLQDVNHDYCLLSWNITSEERDSLKVRYIDENYDAERGCYVAILDLSEDKIQGNLEVKAQNFDIFGNKSLISSTSSYVYGDIYVSTLTNDVVFVSDDRTNIRIDRKMGSVGNYISYERTDGTFTEEEFVTGGTYLLTDAKPGGIIRSKTRYLVNSSDIDYLTASHYLETVMP